MEIRYVRDWCAGSDANPAGIWQEIQVFHNGQNIALGILATSSVPLLGGTGIITNGIISEHEYSFSNAYGTPINVQIDLGQIYDVEKITVWHYNADGRTFKKTKTEVSQDGINWLTVFDSNIEGTYAEPFEGKTIRLKKHPPIKIGEMDIDKIFLGNEPIANVYLDSQSLMKPILKSFKYVRVEYGTTGGAVNPAEIEILAGAVPVQVGGIISANKLPTVYTLDLLVDGTTSTGVYYVSAPVVITVELPQSRTDLTQIKVKDFVKHSSHKVFLSLDGVEWIEAPFVIREDSETTQVFDIPK
jgi:hypothetical protein